MAVPTEKTENPEVPPTHEDSVESEARPASSSSAAAATGAGTTGGFGPAPKAGPASFRERPAPLPGLRAPIGNSNRLAKPPYPVDLTPEGTFKKSDMASLGTAGAIRLMCAQAVKETAIQAAQEAHKDDPEAAALAAADAMETVLSKYLVEGMIRTDGGIPRTIGTRTPGVSKLAREAIIEGITGYRGLTDSDRNKGDLYKRANLLSPFPGSKCRTVPDA